MTLSFDSATSVIVRPRARFLGAAMLLEMDVVAILALLSHVNALARARSRCFWLRVFIKLQEHFFQWGFFSLQAQHFVAAERLNERVHTAAYIEVVGMVVAGHHAHSWHTRHFIRADSIAKLDCHALARLLAQPLYLFDGDDFALANDRHALAHLLDIAHYVRTHEDGLAACLLLQQELVEGALQK